MAKYAEGTTVTANRSRDEIESALKRYGATMFAQGWDSDQHMAVIEFRIRGKRVRIPIRLPERSEFLKTPTGMGRSETGIDKVWETAIRQRWRALLLIVKGKLEAVEAGIFTFEEEFLASFVLPDRSTVGQWMVPQLEEAYRTGEMPALVPMLPKGRGGGPEESA